MTKYHEEFKELISGKEGFELLQFLLKQVVEPVLQKNQYFYRCNQNSNSVGMCAVINEFRDYVRNGQSPPDDRLRYFGETAYTLWLLGIKYCDKYNDEVQRRISEFFKGSAYYDNGVVGFRQFEYELQILCRLVEEGISFSAAPNKGEPDLFITTGQSEFYLEIKLPTSNPLSAFKKGISQIKNRKGVILIGLDMVLSNEDSQNLKAKVGEIASELKQALNGNQDVAVVLEFYTENASETEIGWVGLCKTDAVITVMIALTGKGYTDSSFPPSLG